MNTKPETNESTGSAEPSTPTIRCSVCLGTNVQHHDWINPNTNTVVGDGSSTFRDLANAGESYCNDCEDHSLLEFIPDDEREVLGDLLELEQKKILQRLPGGQWQLAAGGKKRLAARRESHPRTWDDDEIRIRCEDALNSAIGEIQNALGVDDGGWASMHWSGPNHEEAIELLIAYMEYELCRLPGPDFDNGDRVQFTKDTSFTVERTYVTIPALSTGTVIESNPDCLGIVLDEPAVVGPRDSLARRTMMSCSAKGAGGEVWFHDDERNENTIHITLLEEA